MKLVTPLGEIQVLFDGTPISCSVTQLEPNKEYCPDIDGRFKMEVDFIPDGKEHLISCCLFPNQPIEDYPASGERLECCEYYNKDKTINLCIGIEADTGYVYNNAGQLIRFNDDYDYDGEFMKKDDVFYCSFAILPSTKTTHYVFGVAWIFDCTDEDRGNQPWSAVDPIIMRLEGNV